MSGNLLSAGLFRLARGYELNGHAFKVSLLEQSRRLVPAGASVMS